MWLGVSRSRRRNGRYDHSEPSITIPMAGRTGTITSPRISTTHPCNWSDHSSWLRASHRSHHLQPTGRLASVAARPSLFRRLALGRRGNRLLFARLFDGADGGWCGKLARRANGRLRPTLIIPIIMLILPVISKAVVKQRPALQPIISLVGGLVGLAVVGFIVLSLRNED